MERAQVTGGTVEAFRQGQAEALAQIIRVFTPLVRSIVCRFWQSEFDREEAAHVVWLHAYEKRAELDPERAETFPGWLATLARHRCIDRLRKQGRQIGPDAQDPELGLGRIAQPAGAEQALLRKQLLEVLDGFSAKLEGDWRRFFQLHFLRGESYVQVGAALGISQRRCKYMKKVIAAKARKHEPLRAVLGRGEDG